MSVSSDSSAAYASVDLTGSSLRVSAYDRVASLLVSLLFLVGLAVFLLFLLWLSARVFVPQPPIPVEYLDELAGGDTAISASRDFEEPGRQELQDLVEPTLTDKLTAVTDVVTSTAASLDELESHVSPGVGSGDRRRAGRGGDASVARWQRWQVKFATSSVAEYARQLDLFKIELAAIGGGQDSIDYAFNLSQAKPERRTAVGGEEDNRLYMTWRSGALEEFDRQLLARAGIATAGRLIVQFYPRDVEAQMAALESQRAGRHSLGDIVRTVFQVQKTGPGYRFEVTEQDYKQ